jgi:hypothetical protein
LMYERWLTTVTPESFQADGEGREGRRNGNLRPDD